MCIEHANARQLHILNVQFWAWEKELESHRSTSHLFCQLFKNYLVLGKDMQWLLAVTWMIFMRQLIRGGVLMHFTSSCVMVCAGFLVVWGLGADIKQLCALWTWATSASWQTVMQSQQRCTHAIHAAYAHIVQSPENNNKKHDTHASLLAQGTLFWLYWSHTQAHPPPDWL